MWKLMYVWLVLVLLSTGCRPRTTQEIEAEPPPNVFLVSVDTLRADHLGTYGYERNTTSFLDRLASEGVRVAEAVVATHGTTPSHASILTSAPQEVHGVGLTGRTDDSIPTSLLNLPELFHQAGYRTLGVTGGGNVGSNFGFGRGFEVYDDGARGVDQGRERLLRSLGDVSPDQPLFVFFHTYEVHSPYDPPADLKESFGKYESSFETSSANLVAHAHRAGVLSNQDLDHVRARYDEGIVHADRVLESLFSSLRDLGRLNNAIVVVTSDHGEEFGEHGGLVHRDLLYDELLRVPMIFWGPALPTGVTAPASASSLDIAPTLASCAGLEVPDSWHGRDLLCSDGGPNEASAESRTLFSQYGNRRYSARTDRWKLIVTRLDDGLSDELFDLQADPGETRNVTEEAPEVVQSLTRDLRRWRAGLTTVSGDASPVELDPEERERLEALGYL